MSKTKSIQSISELLSQINELVEERDWEQFHSPKNLAMNLQVESSEVAEHFTWLTEPESYQLSPVTVKIKYRKFSLGILKYIMALHSRTYSISRRCEDNIKG